jgi:hypothetical protein
MHIEAADTFLLANAAVPMQQLQQAAGGGQFMSLHFTHDDDLVWGGGSGVACDMEHTLLVVA